jgi:hypothetical protein
MNVLEGIFILASGITAAASAPFLPALAELFNQKDATELHIAQDYVKDPRFFANSFRRKMEPLLAQADGTELPFKGQIKLRKAEDLLIDRELTLTSKTGFRGIAISLGNARFDKDSGSHDLWIRGRADIEDRFRCWTLAVDGDLSLGAGCRIRRWVDSGGTAVIGAGSQLGQSASAAEVLLLDTGIAFQRLFGQPVVVVSSEENGGSIKKVGDPLIDDHAFTDDNGLCFPNDCTIDHDIICRGNVRIGARVHVNATIKAHGKITLLAGTEVDGNVISREGIDIGDDCVITGNVFAEGDVAVGKHVTVGTAEAHKSIYSAGKVVLRAGVRVHGAVISERGGTIE